MTSIVITGTLINDQSEGLTNNDVAISYDDAATTDFFSGAFSTGFIDSLNDLFDPLTTPLTTAPNDGDGNFAELTGAAKTGSSFITVDPDGSTVTSLFFSDPDGDPLNGDQVMIDDDGDPLTPKVALKTIDNQNIYLWSISEDFVIATAGSTKDGNGDITGDLVAAFYLNDASDNLSASVEMVTFMALFHPDPENPDDRIDWSDVLNVSASTSLSFNFDALRSGSELWAVVGSSDTGLLVTGKNLAVDAAGKKTNASDVIHSSQGGVDATIGVNNQLFDNVGETAVLTLVTGFQNTNLANNGGAIGDYVVDPKPNDNKPEGIDYDGYLNVTGALVFLSQSQGNSAKNLDINLLSAGGGTTPEEGFGYIPGLVSDAEVDAETVTVIDDDGVVVGVWSVNPSGTQLASGDTVTDHDSSNGTATITVTIDGNTIDVDGVLGEYSIKFETDGVDTFNRFEVKAEGGQFDIGRVDITNLVTESEPVGDKLFVDDDGPSAQVEEEVDPLVTDDTDVDDPSTDFVPVSALFTLIDFNLDGGGTATLDLRLLSDNVLSGLTDTLTGDPIRFTYDGDDIIGYADDNTNGTKEAGDPIALRYHIDNNGTASDISDDEVIFTQYRAVIHNDPNDPDEATSPALVTAGTVFIDLTVADADLDDETVSFDLSQITQLRDDGPTLSGQNASIRVEEDELSTSAPAPADTSTGITDGDGTDDETDFTNADLQLIVDPGEDTPVKFALNLSVSGAVLDVNGTAMTSKGDAMTWSVVGTEIRAVAGGRIVFTINQTAGSLTDIVTDDVFTVDLRDQIDHVAPADGTGDEEVETLDLTPAFTATDEDGDKADLNGPGNDLKTIRLVVENDVPAITAQILNKTLAFTAGANVSSSLNGAIGADENVNNLTSDGTTKTYTFDSFTIVSGVAGLAGTLSADATKIEFKVAGELFYDIVLDQAGAGQYTFTVYKTPPPAITEFGFNDLFAGQNLFGIIAQDKAQPDGPGLMVFPDNAVLDPVTGEFTNTSGTINTSKGQGPTVIGNGNQAFDGSAPTEGAFFVYVNNPDDDAINGVGLDQNNADDADTVGFAGLFKLDTAQVELVGVNGQKNSAALSIKAYDVTVSDAVDTDDEARDFILNPTIVSDAVNAVTQVNVESVKVFDEDGVLVEWVKDINNDGIGEFQDADGDGDVDADDNDSNVSITFSGLSATASGLNDFYTVEFTTTDDHNVVQVERVAGAYDLGGFNLIETLITADQQINFSVKISDYDGDVDGDVIGDVFDDFKIGIDGTDPGADVLFI